MAGLPKAVIDRANEILDTFMKKSPENEPKTKFEKLQESNENNESITNLINEIELIDINNTTPYQALKILAKIKKRNDF